MAIRIPLADYQRWVKHATGVTRDAAARGLYAAAQRIVADIKSNIIPAESRAPVDRGIYRNGWRAEKRQISTSSNPGTVRQRLVGAIIRNSVPYAVIVEKGARAENVKIGRAMIKALAEWVRRKGIGGHTTSTTRRRKGEYKTTTKFVKPTELEATRIAWAIAKSLQKHGIFNKGNGLRILEKAMAKAPKYIQEEIAREMARELAKGP